MRIPTASATAAPASAAILSISANEEDQAFLEGSKRTDSELAPTTNPKWDVYRAFSLPSALHFLRNTRIGVIVCGDVLTQGTWKELLEQALALQDPPSVILTSRLADDGLWAEALNLGAYDVLAKPFDSREVARIVEAAWVSWLSRQERKKRTLVEKWAVEQWNAAAG